MKVLKIIFKIFVYIFAVIGFILVAGYFAVKYNFTNTIAVVDKNSDKYQEASVNFNKSAIYNSQADALLNSQADMNIKDLEAKINELKDASQALADLKLERQRDLCKIDAIGAVSPVNAANIAKAYSAGAGRWTFSQMVLAVSIRLEDNADFQKNLADCDALTASSLDEQQILGKYQNATGTNLFDWANSDSWDIITKAISKDESVIKRASTILDIKPRLLVSILIVEQLRLYDTQREYFEKFFQPLQILANANKMAWGVMSIKEKTAIDVENNLKNPNSIFYPGEGYEHLLDFKTADPAKERYDRIANEHDHYFSYLYGGLIIKELITQWDDQGYNIENRPEVLATLFNIGFTSSKPKADPQVGGSIINLNGTSYTFGSLAHEFYYSGLIPEFPLE